MSELSFPDNLISNFLYMSRSFKRNRGGIYWHNSNFKSQRNNSYYKKVRSFFTFYKANGLSWSHIGRGLWNIKHKK